MRVLKIVAEGVTTSFRYPHFMQQVHPTFPLPPPSTIYGHIASALGEWFDPKNVKFAYHFSYAAEVKDIEHIIVLKPSSGSRSKLPGTKTPKVLEGNVNPFERYLLFQPRLTLYINRPEWEEAFRSPRYAVVLGRSQDLFTYTDVRVVDLEEAKHAYFEHTLLPYSTTRYTSRGIAMLMPQYLDCHNNRHPQFKRYFLVSERIDSRNDFIWFGEKEDEKYWIDPDSTEIKGARLGLMFHSFIEDENATRQMA